MSSKHLFAANAAIEAVRSILAETPHRRAAHLARMRAFGILGAAA